jgi:hypothetical protein
MPVERGLEPDIEECPLLAWDNRRYENGEPINVGYNGHANLSLDGPSLHIITCAYLGTICVDECPNIWAIVRGETQPLASLG